MPERSRRVVWAEAAVRDLEEIISFIAADSPLNARGVLDRLRAKARSLETSPTGAGSFERLVRKP